MVGKKYLFLKTRSGNLKRRSNIIKGIRYGGCPFWWGNMKNLDNITNTEIKEVIDEYIHSERDRAILKRRYIDGICYEPLAEEFYLSTVQVKRIIYKQSEILFKHLIRN